MQDGEEEIESRSIDGLDDDLEVFIEDDDSFKQNHGSHVVEVENKISSHENIGKRRILDTVILRLTHGPLAMANAKKSKNAALSVEERGGGLRLVVASSFVKR